MAEQRGSGAEGCRREDLRLFEKLVADALLSDDPAAVLRAARDLPPELAEAVAAAEPHGLRLAALIVARLRFERLVHGSRRAAEWFERDPAGFARAFRRYHAAVPPAAHDPRGEGALFEEWASRPGAG